MILVYTLCCLSCAAVNDLVFKFFARKERSRGLFVTMVGIFGTAFVLFMPDKIGDWRMTLLWGVICGVFSAVGNILLLESMTFLSAGVCSTIYRLNLALVVPLSFVFFHENLSLTQFLGVALALAAVICFLPVGDAARPAEVSGRDLWRASAMIVTACVFRAGLGLACKYAPMAGASANGVTLLIDVTWIFSGVVYFLKKEKKYCMPDAGDAAGRKVFGRDLVKLISYGAVSGVLVTGILWFMIQALKIKDANASVVLPIAQMSFLATFLLSVIFLKEKVTFRKFVALLCGVGALLLLSY